MYKSLAYFINVKHRDVRKFSDRLRKMGSKAAMFSFLNIVIVFRNRDRKLKYRLLSSHGVETNVWRGKRFSYSTVVEYTCLNVKI